jgi:5-methylcytosine-specific restriction endonuclease McrA
MQTGYIYGLFDPRQPLDLDQCRYIGQTSSTLQRRLSTHIATARGQSGVRHYHVVTWLRSLLRDDVRPTVIPLVVCPVEQLNALEIAWIQYARAQGWRLTNVAPGGVNNMLDPESRAKLSAAQKGRVLTAEHKAKISASHMGISPSPEVRQRISETLKGRKIGPPSDETRRKIGDAHRGKIISPEQCAVMRESGRARWADPEKKKAYLAAFAEALEDPKAHQRISEGQKRRHAARLQKALETYSESDTYTCVTDTVRTIISTRDNWTCQLCHEPIDPDVPYNDPVTRSVNPRAFNVGTVTPVPKGQPRTIGNSIAAHRQCVQVKTSTGRRRSPESIAKTATANRGTKRSDATRRVLSEKATEREARKRLERSQSSDSDR